MEKTKIETETVNLKLPKNIMELLRASLNDVQQYLEYSVIEAVKADLANQDVFTESLIEKYKIA